MANEIRIDEQQLEQYLLGLLTEEDTERLDELSIVDDDVAWEVARVENDLVDAYVCNELSGERLERFMSVYLASPRRRARLKFAEALLLGARDPSRGVDRHASRRSSRKTAGGAC